QLKADKTSMEGGTPPAGTSYPTIADLKAKVDVIIEKIKALQQDNAPKPPRIQNVVATNIGPNEATLTWEGDPRFKKYVITYKMAEGGELIETVNSNRLDLKNLQENSQYSFKIEGYVGDEVVDRYKNGEFKTLLNKIPMPENVKQLKVDDNTMILTWDKNKLHESYQVVY
ncbi:fibronectin type III domain-containing protein, partial [Emticicia sp. 17c]|uniref:fibronectin type III domain-containing protein n=1 Tax=Emticicia sp. 17c TaxID=3127704 RepID=UPI00301D1E84